MTNNKIREFRNDTGLTQQDLAEKVGCTKQYIQRIEGEHEAVKIDIAFEICSVLEAGFVDVFPETSEIIEKAMERSSFQADVSQGNNETEKMKEFSLHLFEDSDLREGMEKAGIDMFIGQHSLNYDLRGGATGNLQITTQERDRLLRFIQWEGRTAPFMSFYSGAWQILINLDHLLFGHFLFDVHKRSDIRAEKARNVEIFFADRAEPQGLSVEEDEIDPKTHESADQISYLITIAENIDEEDEFFFIEDEDGETAVFRIEDVAMVKIPLWTFNYDLEPPDND